MKKLLTLTLGLVVLTLHGTNMMDHAQTNMLNTGHGRFTQPGPPKGPCTPPPSGMVAWWPLDEAQGSQVVHDLAGGHDGTPMTSSGSVTTVGTVGGPMPVTGSYVLNSLLLDGAYVEVPDSPTLNLGVDPFTIDAWVKYYPLQQTRPIVSKLASPNGTGYFLSIEPAGAGVFKLTLQIDGVKYTGPAVPNSTWAFVAATRNASGVTLYVGSNNTLATPLTVSGSPKNASSPGSPLWIGQQQGPGNVHPHSEIDEVEIFNRALKKTEIEAIFKARSAGKCKKKKEKGMTWFHSTSNATYGTITVGCGPAGPDRCDPAHGDTLCTQQLPVLCIYKPTPAFPLPIGLQIPNEYNQWSGGVVATTQPVAGDTFANSAAVTAYCKVTFGDGWRVAEFHDGVYWNFQAYGGTVSAATVPSTRFWVHINDQKDGNCWQP